MAFLYARIDQCKSYFNLRAYMPDQALKQIEQDEEDFYDLWDMPIRRGGLFPGQR